MKRLRIAVALSAWMTVPAMAQFTYPACGELKPEDFKITEIFSKSGAKAVGGSAGMAEPVQMDVHAVESGEHEMEMHDLSGALVLSRKGGPGSFYSFSDLRKHGIESGLHIVRVKTAKGLYFRKLAL